MEATDSEWQWHKWCKSAPHSIQITTPAPHHSVFTGRMPFLPPNQQRQNTEGSFEIVLIVADQFIIRWRRENFPWISGKIEIDSLGFQENLTAVARVKWVEQRDIMRQIDGTAGWIRTSLAVESGESVRTRTARVSAKYLFARRVVDAAVTNARVVVCDRQTDRHTDRQTRVHRYSYL